MQTNKDTFYAFPGKRKSFWDFTVTKEPIWVTLLPSPNVNPYWIAAGRITDNCLIAFKVLETIFVRRYTVYEEHCDLVWLVKLFDLVSTSARLVSATFILYLVLMLLEL